MELLLGFMLAMGVTMVLIPPLMHVAGRWQFLDQPSERKVHTTPIPRIGGIAIAAGSLLAVIVCGNLSKPMPAVIAALLVLLVFGVYDDRKDLRPTLKLVGQAIAALIVMLWGGVEIESVTFAARHELPVWVSQPLTLFFLLGVTNAINLADGLDGLAGGTTLLSFAAIALLAFTTGNMSVAVAAIVLIGSVLGFLRFNTHPARVFMGDGGSQMLGFAAGVLSIILTQDARAPLSAALPLLLLGIPIVDTLWVMVRRVLSGVSPFKADRHHLHHRLLNLGFTHQEAVVLLYLAQGLWFIGAWFLRYESDLLIFGVFTSTAALLVFVLMRAAQRGWRLRASNEQAVPTSLQALEWLRAAHRGPRWGRWWLMAGLSIYGLLVVRSSSIDTLDAQITVSMLALLLFAACVLRWRAEEVGWVEKAILYIVAAIAVYWDTRGHLASAALGSWRWALFASMALVIALRFRFSRDRRFLITPLDVLIIFAALAVPNLPGSIGSQLELGEGVAKLIVLFYSLETLLAGGGRRWQAIALEVAGLLSLSVLWSAW